MGVDLSCSNPTSNGGLLKTESQLSVFICCCFYAESVFVYPMISFGCCGDPLLVIGPEAAVVD